MSPGIGSCESLGEYNFIHARSFELGLDMLGSSWITRVELTFQFCRNLCRLCFYIPRQGPHSGMWVLAWVQTKKVVSSPLRLGSRVTHARMLVFGQSSANTPRLGVAELCSVKTVCLVLLSVSSVGHWPPQFGQQSSGRYRSSRFAERSSTEGGSVKLPSEARPNQVVSDCRVALGRIR